MPVDHLDLQMIEMRQVVRGCMALFPGVRVHGHHLPNRGEEEKMDLQANAGHLLLQKENYPRLQGGSPLWGNLAKWLSPSPSGLIQLAFKRQSFTTIAGKSPLLKSSRWSPFHKMNSSVAEMIHPFSSCCLPLLPSSLWLISYLKLRDCQGIETKLESLRRLNRYSWATHPDRSRFPRVHVKICN